MEQVGLKSEQLEKEKNELIQRLKKTKWKRQQVRHQNQQLKTLTEGWIHRYNQLCLQNCYVLQKNEEIERKRSSLKITYDKLCEIDVLSDTIFISHRGFYATINGLRLAISTSASIDTSPSSSSDSRENHHVPWHELNAGIGFLALLIQILQQELHIAHKSKFIIIPRGSYSKVSSRKTNQQWDLFYQPSTFQFFARRNWNTAMNILSYCILEVALEIKSRITTFSLPFSMEICTAFEGDWIGTIQIEKSELSYQGDNAAAWTRNMRFIAANLKVMQAFVLDIVG